MITFNIYKKQEKFYWTDTLIVWTTFIFCILVAYLRKIVLEHVEMDMIETSLILIAFGSLTYGFIMWFTGFIRDKPLKGIMEGILILDSNEIIIDNEIYNLIDIKKIEFDCWDYYGKFIGSSRHSFEASLSQGIDNTISLTLHSGKKITCNFELRNKYGIEAARSELILYHMKEKISFLRLIEYLKITDYKQRQELKNEISNMDILNH